MDDNNHELLAGSETGPARQGVNDLSQLSQQKLHLSLWDSAPSDDYWKVM